MANRKSAPRRVSSARSQTRGATNASSTNALSLRGLNATNAQRMLRSWSKVPAVRAIGGAVVGGLAIYGVARLVKAIMANREQISEFVTENLEMVEGKIKNFRDEYSGSDSVDAH